MRDQYVKAAKKDDYRSRAAYKLIELNEKKQFLVNRPLAVFDLGSAPGSWCQVLRRRFPLVKVIAIDLIEMECIENVTFIKGDFVKESRSLLASHEAADVILSYAK
jgi:23S rRNA (uridine2552-2'-O)-methyltransferase